MATSTLRAHLGSMKTLHQNSMLKVMLGFNTIEEALSNVPPDLI
jgi:hypothetical protein